MKKRTDADVIKISTDNVLWRVNTITQEILEEKIVPVNYMELFVLTHLFPRTIQQSSETIFCCAKGSISHITEIAQAQLENWLSALQPEEELRDIKILSELTKHLFGLDYYIGFEEVFASDPRYRVRSIEQQKAPGSPRERIMQEARHTHTTADGSVIIEQSDGSRVKLKSKLGEMGKTKQSQKSPEILMGDDEAMTLKADPRDVMREQLMRINKSEEGNAASAQTPKTAPQASQSHSSPTAQPQESLSVSEGVTDHGTDSAKGAFWEDYFHKKKYKIYYDENSEAYYLSLASLLEVLLGVDLASKLEEGFVREGALVPGKIEALLQQFSMDMQLDLGSYKDMAFHDKNLGKRILLTLQEIFPDDVFVEAYGEWITEGMILRRYSAKTISKRERVMDLLF